MPTTASTVSHRPEPMHKNTPIPIPRSVDVRMLLGDAQLLTIKHGDSRYILRMTRNNKLILTK
ncbi:hemin uptake protein HemP [Thiocystis violascens]|uniref:Hemin uptake protein hemP n=1 Tax=Thiocystis violascens (strain ATCC 17096 / DSM 198 / 6111) TaxID=765911 RepID=I3Y8J3_THIV6|nr:hemin uptake protein HemP [Thiocystis violascens]AFL73311.1 Hemin uptake protein hemP [Thiocystis violascens DSM 198]